MTAIVKADVATVRRRALAIGGTLALTGCATLMNGTTQTISITSVPPGATATVYLASWGGGGLTADGSDEIRVLSRGEEKPVAVVTTPAEVTLRRSSS